MHARRHRGAVRMPEWVVVLTGSVLVAFVAFCFAAAVWRELYPGTPPRPDVRRLPRAMLEAQCPSMDRKRSAAGGSDHALIWATNRRGGLSKSHLVVAGWRCAAAGWPGGSS